MIIENEYNTRIGRHVIGLLLQPIFPNVKRVTSKPLCALNNTEI